MSPLDIQRETSLAAALERLRLPGWVPMGGGTDLLATIEQGLAHPAGVVDVRSLPELQGISPGKNDALRIGAACAVADIGGNSVIHRDFPLLARACADWGTDSLRATSTIGGSLAQRPQCSYYRRNVPCLKNGGSACPAHDGDNAHLAILEGSPCWMVHPSDPAVALVALDADIEITSAGGARTVPAADFFVLPIDRMARETVLDDGELITAVHLPAAARGGLQHYARRAHNDSDTFDFVSLAAARRIDGDVRLVLGGVSPRPYRVYTSVEEEAISGGLDEEAIAGLADRALLDAEPLSMNGEKIEVAAALLRDAITVIAAE